MVLWVDATCEVCKEKFGIGDRRRMELVVSRKPLVCGKCQKEAKEARIAGYKAKLKKYPAGIQLSAYSAAAEKLLIKLVGEEEYWKTVADQIKE